MTGIFVTRLVQAAVRLLASALLPLPIQAMLFLAAPVIANGLRRWMVVVIGVAAGVLIFMRGAPDATIKRDKRHGR